MSALDPALIAGLVGTILPLAAGWGGGGRARGAEAVLNSPLAGSWYQADPAGLRAELTGYLSAVPAAAPEPILALILPHAGYRYCGPVAAAGLKTVEGQAYRRVIVLGPTHRVNLPGRLCLPGFARLATPLGEVEVDAAARDRLAKDPLFAGPAAAQADEHSAQIIVPLLQATLKPGFKLLPLVVGQLDADAVRKTAEALRPLVDQETLVVASSDFTHYGPRFGYMPFMRDVPANLERLADTAYEAIAARDAGRFLAQTAANGDTICGRHAIAVLLALLPPGSRPRRLAYANSGDLTGDYSDCVSYQAVAFAGTWPAASPAEAKGETVLAAADKQNLLALARRSIEFVFAQRREPTPEETGVTITPAMQTVMGAFVTLHKHGQLRGCIGEIFPRRPLCQAVCGQAVNAAFNDHRFNQLTLAELSEVDLEISALTPPRPVAGWNEIEIGRHGMVIEKAGRSAVFLPQVAPEQGWDLATTLTHLCRKAGLPADAWHAADAKFTVFEAIVFGEKSP